MNINECRMDDFTESLDDDNSIDGFCNRPIGTDCKYPYKDCTECEYFIQTRPKKTRQLNEDIKEFFDNCCKFEKM